MNSTSKIKRKIQKIKQRTETATTKQNEFISFVIRPFICIGQSNVIRFRRIFSVSFRFIIFDFVSFILENELNGKLIDVDKRWCHDNFTYGKLPMKVLSPFSFHPWISNYLNLTILLYWDAKELPPVPTNCFDNFLFIYFSLSLCSSISLSLLCNLIKFIPVRIRFTGAIDNLKF